MSIERVVAVAKECVVEGGNEESSLETKRDENILQEEEESMLISEQGIVEDASIKGGDTGKEKCTDIEKVQVRNDTDEEIIEEFKAINRTRNDIRNVLLS